jgi:hypothetical protein
MIAVSVATRKWLGRMPEGRADVKLQKCTFSTGSDIAMIADILYGRQAVRATLFFGPSATAFAPPLADPLVVWEGNRQARAGTVSGSGSPSLGPVGERVAAL